MIKLENFSKRYGEQLIFDNVNFEINKNGMYALIGLSGSGKTTLFNILGGIDTKYEGNYFLNNTNAHELDFVANYYDNIAIVYQDYKLFEQLTVYDNIKMGTHKSEAEIDELLQQFKLYELKKVLVKYLSGGERQRTAVIRAIINNPRLLLLDEPTAALDDRNTKRIIEYLKALENDLIIFIISHDERMLDCVDTIYELENQTINIVKEDITGQITESFHGTEKKPNLNKYVIKNMTRHFKKLWPSYLSIIMVSILLCLLSFAFIPSILASFEYMFDHFNTSEVYMSGNMESDYSEEDIAAIEALPGVISVEVTSDAISKYVNWNYTIETTTTFSETFINCTLGDVPEAIGLPVAYMAPISAYNYMAREGSVGEIPTTTNEIAVGSDFVQMFFNTTDYETVIGETIKIPVKTNETGEIQNVEVEIVGVYPLTADEVSFSASQFENYLKSYETSSFPSLGFSEIQIYTPPIDELPPAMLANLENTLGFTLTGGYLGLLVILDNDVVTDDTIAQIEAIDEDDYTNVTEYSLESLFEISIKSFILFSIFIIIVVILILLIFLITLKFRREEFAKYYLLGYKKRAINFSFFCEYMLFTLISLPIIYLASKYLFNEVMNYFLPSRNVFIFVFTLLVMTIIILILTFCFSIINSKHRLIKNLKESND